MMLGVVDWDIAGIVASFATLVTAVVGSIILFRANTRQHDDNKVAAQDRIQEAVTELKQTFDAHMHHVGHKFETVDKNFVKSFENQETMFAMIVDLDTKVTKPAVRTKKTVTTVSSETPVAVKVGVDR